MDDHLRQRLGMFVGTELPTARYVGKALTHLAFTGEALCDLDESKTKDLAASVSTWAEGAAAWAIACAVHVAGEPLDKTLRNVERIIDADARESPSHAGKHAVIGSFRTVAYAMEYLAMVLEREGGGDEREAAREAMRAASVIIHSLESGDLHQLTRVQRTK